MEDDWVYLNGSTLRRSEAKISPMDRGFLYGDGFFETVRIVRGGPFLFDRHLDRMNRSCRQTGWGGGVDPGEIARAVAELVDRNGISDGYLRITASRGLHEGSLTALEASGPTVFIEVRHMELPPLEEPPPFILARSPYRRDETSPLVRHKALSYQGNLLALAEGRGRGADEVFILNSLGNLTEGAITNLFLVRDGKVLTPDVGCGLLPGITREIVMELCAEHGIPLELGRYFEEDLAVSDEVFCTNSLRGVVGVKAILEYPAKQFAERPITRLLQRSYAGRVSAESAAE